MTKNVLDLSRNPANRVVTMTAKNVRHASAERLLQRCEKTLKEGIKHFLAVGEALLTIRSKRLYTLKGYTAFEDYCQKEWGLTRAHASNLIQAVATEEELSTYVDREVLENEFQARQYRQLGESGRNGIKLALVNGATMAEALSRRRKEARPSEKLNALVQRICKLLDSTDEPGQAFEALHPILAWYREYSDREAAVSKADGNGVNWMLDLKAKFNKAA